MAPALLKMRWAARVLGVCAGWVPSFFFLLLFLFFSLVLNLDWRGARSRSRARQPEPRPPVDRSITPGAPGMTAVANFRQAINTAVTTAVQTVRDPEFGREFVRNRLDLFPFSFFLRGPSRSLVPTATTAFQRRWTTLHAEIRLRSHRHAAVLQWELTPSGFRGSQMQVNNHYIFIKGTLGVFVSGEPLVPRSQSPPPLPPPPLPHVTQHTGCNQPGSFPFRMGVICFSSIMVVPRGWGRPSEPYHRLEA